MAALYLYLDKPTANVLFFMPISTSLAISLLLAREEPAVECSRNEVPASLPVPAATSQEPPLPFPPAGEYVPRPPVATGSAAVRGRCRPCASPGLAWLPRGSEALAHLDVKL